MHTANWYTKDKCDYFNFSVAGFAIIIAWRKIATATTDTT